ncbi:uncharacterized protein LOC115401977 [Salarias fasciatus]|uniref:uncharacterized protein LOC115401977 n=1 Tax=Salarias fasciatus TaxID=181472 RepID=UPI0011765ED7|nr:uncharacterized protein LOC115401977 [Salarias fasciatus]
MLAEGFLRLLHYREERKFASRQMGWETKPHCSEPVNSAAPDSADLQVPEAPTGLGVEGPDSTRAQGLRASPRGPAGLSIPGCSPMHIVDCSLLEQYPDLQVVDPGHFSLNPSRASLSQFNLLSPYHEALPHPELAAPPEPQADALTSVPDQGYLVMGHSANISLDLPGSGLEPMSNSVLNGLLEKQLEEVYMQHLTDNLARCNSHLGNSLLHGLVPPPQPGSQAQGPVSLEDSQEDSCTKVSHLNTHTLAICSSNFSSPVLRISEAADPYLQ